MIAEDCVTCTPNGYKQSCFCTNGRTKIVTAGLHKYDKNISFNSNNLNYPQVQGNNIRPQTFKNGSVSMSGNLLNMGLTDNWIGKNLKFWNFLKYYNY